MAIDKQAIQADVEKFVKIYCSTGARITADIFTKIASLTIQEFYNDYSPKYYDRTFDMRDNSYKKYLHNNGRSYTGGVRISPNSLDSYKRTPGPNYPYGQSNPTSIFYGVWYDGYRGPHANSSESPLDKLIRNTVDSPHLVEEICTQARRMAASSGYKVITITSE